MRRPFSGATSKLAPKQIRFEWPGKKRACCCLCFTGVVRGFLSIDVMGRRGQFCDGSRFWLDLCDLFCKEHVLVIEKINPLSLASSVQL